MKKTKQMKKLLLVAAFIFSSFSFSQNGIEAYEGTFRILTKNEFLYNISSETGKVLKVMITDKVLRRSKISKLETNKLYDFQFLDEHGKLITYYIKKNCRQNEIDEREIQDSISRVLKPKQLIIK